MPPISLHRLVKVVGSLLGLEAADFLDRRRRHPRIGLGRRVVVLAARRREAGSYPEIAKALWLRSHTSVMSLHGDARSRADRDPIFSVLCDFAAILAEKPKGDSQ